MAAGFNIYKQPKDFQKRYKLAITLLVGTAAFLALIFLITAGGSVLARFAVAIVVLVACGHIIANTNGIKDSYGAYLLGGKRGIGLVGWLSRKNPKLWIAFADWGLVLGFGIGSFFLFKEYVNTRTILFGIATIAVVILFVYPYLPLVISFINIPQITSRISSSPASGSSGYAPLFYFFLAGSLALGFSFSTIALMLFSGGAVLYTISLFILGLLKSQPNYSVLTQQIPGVAPLIPGLTIPFFAGIISLFILLVVHEFSHGVLARIAKIKIKSIGAILFGIIPLGAFVEPDEREVRKLKQSLQNRISIAGISANMLASLAFFVLTLAVLYFLLPNVDTGGVRAVQVFRNYSAYGVIEPNSVVLGWDNITIRNTFDLAKAEASYMPGNAVNVLTNLGSFALTPDENGRIGIFASPALLTPMYQLSNFLFAVAALSFGLNFFVAIFNLLPIPGFDGWRIYQNKIKDKRLLKAISWILIATIVLNILPWVWTIG